MMQTIELTAIKKDGCRLIYAFSVSEGLRKFFSGKPFVVEYPEEITAVPDAVAAVPFVCNVLPIVWLTDSVLRVRELDQTFFECIPEVKKGYEAMFPESIFAGSVAAEKVVSCEIPATGGCGAFFSGGLDSVQTLIRHWEESPDLISIWGSDIPYASKDGWKRVYSGIEEVSRRFHLSNAVIHSSFREFDEENALDREFHKQLKDGWWHGVKHGIGLLGHAAPYAYLHGLSTLYIASSNCAADGPVRCASNPLIDNHVRFAGCKVIHDGFQFSRQDKLHNIVEFCGTTHIRFPLHVCWQSRQGSNCCHCEKCFRTMAGLLAEGADPAEYGFTEAKENLAGLRRYLVEQCGDLPALKKHWTYIGRRICENKQQLQAMPYWKQIKWIASADFTHPETWKMPLRFRIDRLYGRFREWGSARKRRFSLWKKVLFPLGKKVYLLGTPLHTNIGDSAIVLAEKRFLRSAGIGKRRIIELSAPQLRRDLDWIVSLIGPKALLCWHGGGNMGNQWWEEEQLRRQAMARFPNNPTILFPQTIYYTPDDAGQLEQERSIPVYNRKKNLTLAARERTSYEIMGKLYPCAASLLTPDMVLSAAMEDFGVKPGSRDGVLLCMREDAERAMTDEERTAVESVLRKKGLACRETEMYCEETVTIENRADRVRQKIAEFAAAKLVITDRLHGMVFAAITGTPCMVFPNYNHKVRGACEWLRYLPYIRYAETVLDVERDLTELLAMEHCRFDNTPLMPYFEKLAQVVKAYACN